MGLSSSGKIEVMTEIAEAKRIYSALEHGLAGPQNGCVVVSSSSPGEGKSLTSAGMARLASCHGAKRVLLMDMNWYAPTLDAVFGVEHGFSVRDLGSDPSLSDLVVPTPYENLHLLPAPKMDVAGFTVNSKEFLLGSRLMQEARASYDLTLVDTASIFPTNRRMMDPVTLARSSDGVLLVVLAGVTPRQKVKGVVSILRASGPRIVGVVVNHWKNPLK